LSIDGVNLKALFRRATAFHSTGAFQGAASDVELILLLDASNEHALQLKDLLSHHILNVQQPAPKQLAPVDNVSGTVPKAVKTEVNRDVEVIDVQKLKITAQQYLADGLHDKVIALLAKYLRSTDTDSTSFSNLMKSDQTSLLHLLAAAYSFPGDHSHAVATYERILQIDSTNFRALLKRADSQLKLAVEVLFPYAIVDSMMMRHEACLLCVDPCWFGERRCPETS
jgi:tetratricopeptide (TPR) repeat protein